MFSELPKLFDRNFAIAFFLPAALFVLASVGIMDGFGRLPQTLPKFRDEALTATTLAGVASWFGGGVLLVLNYEIYRLLEGYGPFNPFGLLKPFALRRYRRQARTLKALNAASSSYGNESPAELEHERQLVMKELASKYPPTEELVLPTAFGNTIRAFEAYTFQMYGLDAIPGWTRLQAVIPKDYRQLVDDAKALTDFWVNLSVLGFLLMLEYVSFVVATGRVVMTWIPLLAVGLVVIASNRSRESAAAWGDTVKGAFDVFLPELRKKLSFAQPSDIKAERLLWTRFSQALAYREPRIMPERSQASTDSTKN